MKKIIANLKTISLFVLFLSTVQAKSFGLNNVVMRDTNSLACAEDTVDAEAADSTETEVLKWPQSMTVGIDKLLEDPMFERSQVAVVVYNLDADTVMYNYMGRQLMRPASVMKLFTASTALDNLGGDHLFETRLYYRGVISDSVLHGDIYIKGGFDPMFGYDDMYSFVDNIKLRGINRIDGKIYTDVSFKDTLKWGEGWCWDDKETTLTPLLYDGKDIFVTKFMQRLTHDGIAHPNTYVSGRAEGDSLVLLDIRSHTVDQMLTHTMKNSDNLYAESLFYQLGAKSSAPYASTRRSVEKVNALIRKLGFDPSEYTVADGSGLSLYNYVTPNLVVGLLKYVWNNNNILNHLYPTLPVSGVDGTLRNRMINTPAEYVIHAKTGTLRKVSTLAGYAKAYNGVNLALCIFNQGILNAAEGKRFQDKVCSLMVE